MTGENFKTINRKNTELINLKNKLQETKEKLWEYIKQNEYCFDNYSLKLEQKIKKLEMEIDIVIQHDNLRRSWK